jgi:hypothetical protein
MSCAIPPLQFPPWTGVLKRGRGAPRGARGPSGPNLTKFERQSRRRSLAIGRWDVTITAMTYLQAYPIAVITKTQLLHALRTSN